MSEPPEIGTVGELRRSAHEHKTVRQEIRDNLLAMLAAGTDPWPGLHGFGRTVLPQLERALLAGHDVVLLGERGQGKTRLLRTLVGLLDEWTHGRIDAEGPARHPVARWFHPRGAAVAPAAECDHAPGDVRLALRGLHGTDGQQHHGVPAYQP